MVKYKKAMLFLVAFLYQKKTNNAFAVAKTNKKYISDIQQSLKVVFQ